MRQQELISKLRKYAKDHKILQKELAYDLGVTVLTIGRYLSGEKRKMHELTKNSIWQYLKSRGKVN